VALLSAWLRKGDRVLDIGAGTGAFVAAANAASWNATGIEPHQGFAAFAREHYGAHIHATTLEAAPLPDAHFDLVTSSHVFEHLRNPLDAFRRVHRLLREGGIFHVGVPDIADPRRTPIARFHFGHVHGFTRETLTMMALKAGFEPIPEANTEGPVLLLRRLPAAVADWLCFPDHANQMRRFFAEHTLWRHLTSPVPYQRFMQRMRRFRREKRQLQQ
jgi:SAM-dependent methyltransferase